MNLDDLKPDWQRADFSGSQFNEIAASVKQKGTKFESDIFRCDMIEAAAAGFVVIVAMPAALYGPSLMFRIGFLLVILGAIEVVIVMASVRRKDRLPTADLSLREYCQIELRRIDRQIWLLEHVIVWYIGPLFVGAPFVVLSVPAPLMFHVLFFVFAFGTGCFVYWLNKRGARRELRPLRDSIASVLAQCNAEPPDPEASI